MDSQSTLALRMVDVHNSYSTVPSPMNGHCAMVVLLQTLWLRRLQEGKGK